jgi:hypothetical protein
VWVESVHEQSSVAVETRRAGPAHAALVRFQGRASIDARFVFHATNSRSPTVTAEESWYQTGWVG